jgi:DNA-directed RNA polymerase specialized sigma24 family protein
MARRAVFSKAAFSEADDEFPPTQTTVLAEAAAGNWDRFFAIYLRPCWAEVVRACRQRGLSLGESEELFQELSLRLMREAKARRSRLAGPAHRRSEVEIRGNLPRRYLEHRRLFETTARFRTYLKSVIEHLVLERLRERRRLPQPTTSIERKAVDPAVAEIVSASVDRPWLLGCCDDAVRRLRQESETAATRGRRRLFGVLHGTLVERKTSRQLAAELAIDRTTVSQLLAQGRRRFIELLGESTGIDDVGELKQLLAAAADVLAEALADAGEGDGADY